MNVTSVYFGINRHDTFFYFMIPDGSYNNLFIESICLTTCPTTKLIRCDSTEEGYTIYRGQKKDYLLLLFLLKQMNIQYELIYEKFIRSSSLGLNSKSKKSKRKRRGGKEKEKAGIPKYNDDGVLGKIIKSYGDKGSFHIIAKYEKDRDPEERIIYYLKGSTSHVFRKCSAYITLQGKVKKFREKTKIRILNELRDVRSVAFAFKIIKNLSLSEDESEESNLILISIFCFEEKDEKSDS